MTAPDSYSRVLAALRRLSPSFPSTDSDKAVGKELGSIATGLATAYDRFDAIWDELFPDSADETIERWEKITRVSSFTADALADRRQRVLNVFRRVSGPRLDQLEKVLAGPFDLDADEIVFVEVLRQMIDDAIRFEFSTLITIPAATLVKTTYRSFLPGKVDDGGVRIKLGISLPVFATFSLTGPNGVTWTLEQTDQWQWNRTDFTGIKAAGYWTLNCTGTAGDFLNSWQLLVSNDVDSGQIYNFFAFRDPALSGTPDLVEAQRLFHRTALGHFRSFVVESLAFTVGDEHSLVGRDLIGV